MVFLNSFCGGVMEQYPAETSSAGSARPRRHPPLPEECMWLRQHTPRRGHRPLHGWERDDRQQGAFTKIGSVQFQNWRMRYGDGCNMWNRSKRICVTQESPEAAASSEQIYGRSLESLPQDLLDRIAAALPVHAVLQFRSVSKAFIDIIWRRTFLQPRLLHRATEEKFSPVIFFLDSYDVWQWLGFDRMSARWRRLPSLYLPPTPDPNILLAMSGSLCVNVSKSQNVEVLVVCNPLTGAIKDLPPLNFPRHPVLLNILLDKFTDHYKVIVAGSATIGNNKLSRKTEVYDSKTHRWEVVGDVPGPEYALKKFQTGAFSKGFLYCVGFISTGDMIAQGLLAYHVETKKWIHNWECKLPRLPCCRHIASSSTQIFESEGSIFLYWEQEHSQAIAHFCIAKLLSPALSNPSTSPNYIPSWTVMVSENKAGSRGPLVYPENICVSQGLDKVCIFNTLDLTGLTYKIGAEQTSWSVGLDRTSPLPDPRLVLSTMQDFASSSSTTRRHVPSSAFEPSFHTPV